MSTRTETMGTTRVTPECANVTTTHTLISRKGCCSVRHGLAFILLLCNFSIYAQQISLSIAMPAMVNHTVLPSQPNAFTEGPPADTPDIQNETLGEIVIVTPVYDWNPAIQGIILSSINYGSFLAPIPVGYVAGIFGAKYVVGVGLLLSSVLTLFIPLAADAGMTLLIVLRVVQGIAQVMVSTGQYSIWVKWAPPLERSQLITTALAGGILGGLILLTAGGVLCQTIGWPYIFYSFGGIGCACAFLWFPLVYDDPANHPFISTGEKEYIVGSLVQQANSPDWSVPIKAMIKSLPLWSILVSSFCIHWRFHFLMSYIPTYINSVLEANFRDSGILSALPLVGAFSFIVLGGQLAGFLLSRKILRLITIRKLFTLLGVLVPTGLLVSLHWVSSSHSTTIAFLIVACSFGSLCEVGVLINIVDIAPRYSAFLRGLAQAFSYLSGAISPTIAGCLMNQDSELGWRNAFFIAAAIDFVGLIFFLIVGRAEVQDWA